MVRFVEILKIRNIVMLKITVATVEIVMHSVMFPRRFCVFGLSSWFAQQDAQ